MKYVQSIWSKPSLINPDKVDNSLDVKFFYKNLYSYLMSVLFLKKYGKVELYCDEKSYEHYSILPYDKIHIIDFEEDGVSEKFWIWSKIKVHELMDEPYIHVDGDVFLFKDIFKDVFKKHTAVVQSVENKYNMGMSFHNTYEKSLDGIEKIPIDIDWNKYGLTAYNCGVVGFSNMEVKNEYVHLAKKSLQLASKHHDFGSIRKKYDGLFLLIEQSLLYLVLSDNNIKPFEVLCENEINRRIKIGLNWMDIGNKIGYAHYWGLTKYNDDTILRIKKRIKNYFPEYYYIIEKIESY